MAKKIERSNMQKFDSKGNLLRDAVNNGDGQEQNFHWWLLEKDEQIAQSIAATVAFIATHQSNRLEQLTVSTKLYGNTSAYNLAGAAFTRSSASTGNSQGQRMSYNLCSSVIDTLVSKIAKNKVIPTFVTNGGIWGMQKKAKDLSKFIEGCFYECDVHAKTVSAFRDAAVWGTGILHIYSENERICVEKVFPHEIFVDLVETLSTAPRQLHRVKIVDRGVLADLFKDDEKSVKAIVDAMPASYQEVGGAGTAADLVKVVESWHLPSGPEADDGLHTICIDDTVLFKEEYTKDYFPFVFTHYSKRLAGFWGQGACERLQNLQGEINRLMILVQRSMWMGGSFKVLVENGSKVVSQHLNNDVGAIIHYTGTPPQYITPPMIQQDIYPYIDSLIQKGYQQEGVSQLSAASLKPEGVDSGKAMRAMTDIEDDRFLSVEQEMEAFNLEIAFQMIEKAKEIYKYNRSYKVTFSNTKFMETIDWKDIKLKDDEYVLKAFPTSQLKNDITGRLADIQEMMQAGLISPSTGKRLMQMPDIEMEEAISNAPENLLHKILEEMLYEDTYRPPEPFYDLTLAKKLALEYYNYADYMNAPEDVLGRLRQFLTQIDDLTGIGPQAMAAATQGAVPQASPTAPPVNNMIPNVPGVQ
jgi:hypothetical protein